MILDESGFTAGMNNAVKKLNSFDETIERKSRNSGSSLGSIWKIFAGSFLASGVTRIVGAGFDLIKGSISGAVDRVDTMNNALRNFQNMGFSNSEIMKNIGKNGLLSQGIQGLPTALNDAISHVQLLASSTGDLTRSTQIFKALNDGILGFGGSTDQVNEAVIQLSQSFSNGKVDAQTWNSMINAQLGPTLSAIAKKMGITMGDLKEGLSQGKISVEEFQNQLIEMDTKGGGGLKSLSQIAKDSTKGIKTSIQNAKTAVTRGVGEVIEGLNKALVDSDLGGFKGIIDKVGSSMESFLKVIAANIPTAVSFLSNLFNEIQKFGSALKFMMPFLVPAATAFGAFMFQLKGIPAIIKSFNNFKNAIIGVGNSLKIMGAIAAANSFVLIIGAVVGAIAVFGYFMATNEELRNKVISIWNDVKDSVIGVLKNIKDWGIDTWNSAKEMASNAVEGVKDAWSGTKEWFSNTWKGIKDGATGLFDKTVETSRNAVDSVKNAWSNMKKWFSDTWQSIKDSAREKWNGIKGSIMSVAGPLITGIKNAFLHVTFYLETLWNNLVEIGKNVFEILKNVILAPVLFITSMISGGWEETKNNMIAVWNNIKESAINIWESIKNIFVSYFTIWTGFKLTLINIWNEVVNQAKSIWLNIKYFFINLWIDIKYFAIQKWIELKFSIIQTWIDLKYNAITTWNNIKQFFKDTWKNIKDTAYNTWISIKNTMINTWNNIKDSFWNIVTGIVNSAENAWTNLKNGVSNAINRVKEIFNSLREVNLFEIGKNIIDGLINGVKEKWNALKDTIKGIAGNIKNWIKGALDIHSPSRWMRDMVGKNIVQGIIVGIDKEQSKLDQTMTNLVKTPSVQPVVNGISHLPITQTKQNISASETKEIHLHLNVYGDLPDSMVRKITTKIKTELTRQMKRDAGAVGGTLYAT
ncbi:TPA: tape measure protein [Enterococcus faecium]|nr:tape measure protein [Enterococcus faecium]HCI0933556.1 tape measure protein [Enterococcus faecium]HCI0954154.1 tape measure protein [Enterococcus faecium]HCI0980309.1 tape measure protein [Enterococcus faecium]HCI1082468.1 tape measure protein [Enterococcus faecium]